MRDEVVILPSYKIERSKWDDCISASANGLIYCTSLYLDHMADSWSGIILNNYEAVMPVPWRKKFGIRYCYDVPFIQQLGIISNNATPVEDVFINALHSFCKYGTFPLNYENKIDRSAPHTNFIMHLDKSYDVIARRFTKDVTQNIRRSENMGLVYENAESEEAIEIFREHYGKRGGITDEQFKRFGSLCNKLDEKGDLIVRKVRGPANRTLAIISLPKDIHRMYNLMNSTVPEGKATEANFFLLSRLWKEFAGSGSVFDFEGSDLPGVRDFYRKFGPVNQPYYKIHFNHLPWPMKIWKK